jgi:hypothetical protein
MRMQHQNPNLDFDDTRIILQGAACTIAARSAVRKSFVKKNNFHMGFSYLSFGIEADPKTH